jgi:predicted nucleotidyltransferase
VADYENISDFLNPPELIPICKNIKMALWQTFGVIYVKTAMAAGVSICMR